MRLLALLVLIISTPVFADSGRRFDARGNYDGSYREQRDGTFRLYDERGNYEGKIVPDDRGRYRIYNEDGDYEKTVEAEDE